MSGQNPNRAYLVTVNVGRQEERAKDQQTFRMILFAEVAVLSTDDNRPSPSDSSTVSVQRYQRVRKSQQ